MSKYAAAFLLLAALVVSSGAAPVTDWRAIVKTMDSIPTAAGVSLRERLESCKITIHKDKSWMETRNAAWPQYAAKPGDTVLKLVMDLSAVQAGSPVTTVEAVWLIENRKPTALSSWANVLQNRPVPLGYTTRDNC